MNKVLGDISLWIDPVLNIFIFYFVIHTNLCDAMIYLWVDPVLPEFSGRRLRHRHVEGLGRIRLIVEDLVDLKLDTQKISQNNTDLWR